jgi:hydroxymethylbilane synthase
LRIATRGSPLALWQARHVAALLGTDAELVVVQTLGDRRRDVPVEDLGAPGAFVAEVRNAVLDGRADAAVHSAKDLPTAAVENLCLAAIPERGDPRDALAGAALHALPSGGRVGTGSARRRVQLTHARPDLEFGPIRGNIETRLGLVGNGFDAVVVAAAALQRLGIADRAAELLEIDVCVPQPAQAALAVECRSDDDATRTALAPIEHAPSRSAVDCERAFLAAVESGCGAPVGAYAETGADGELHGVAVMETGDGRLERTGADGSDPVALGRAMAAELLRRNGPAARQR